MKNKGFTLIELLVVVAIIGILATVVLASLGEARIKAKDSAVKSELSQMRAEAELVYEGNFATFCDDEGSVFEKFSTAVENLGGTIGPDDCEADAGSYRVIATLPSTEIAYTTNIAHAEGENAFCVNSLGTAAFVAYVDVKGDGEELEGLTPPACTAAEEETPAGAAYYWQYNGSRATCVDCIEAATGSVVGSGFGVPECAGAMLENGDPPVCA